MSNPFPTRPGFARRVAYAKAALRRLGADCCADIYSRAFDACFEMFDGDAVVWALMHHALSGDELLARGVRAMGAQTWLQWRALYESAKPAEQGDLFAAF